MTFNDCVEHPILCVVPSCDEAISSPLFHTLTCEGDLPPWLLQLETFLHTKIHSIAN